MLPDLFCLLVIKLLQLVPVKSPIRRVLVLEYGPSNARL